MPMMGRRLVGVGEGGVARVTWWVRVRRRRR